MQRKRRPARNDEARQERVEAILAAALDVFSEKGFAPARLEDVAARAGIAKGTIYLYFPSKEALFEALIRSGIAAPIAAMEARLLALDGSTEVLLRALFAWLRQEVLGTRRVEIARLVLSEAPRFPELARLYHEEVVSRGLRLVRRIAERARERGEFGSGEIEAFPHLVIAPALVALLWTASFERFEPLDVEGLFGAHVDLLLRASRAGAP